MICPYPTIKFVAWGAREPHKIFVPDPLQRGRYIYTDNCVAQVVCPACKSIPGEPCKRTYGEGIHYHAVTHTDRRNAAQRYHRGERPDDVIKPHIKLKIAEVADVFE